MVTGSEQVIVLVTVDHHSDKCCGIFPAKYGFASEWRKDFHRVYRQGFIVAFTTALIWAGGVCLHDGLMRIPGKM